MGPRYLQIVLDVEKDAETLKSIFEAGGMVYVKQRAGHLSYEEDPKVIWSSLRIEINSIKLYAVNEWSCGHNKYW